MNTGLTVLSAAAGLVVLTVTIHAIGFDLLLRAMARSRTLAASGIRRVGGSLIVLTCWLVIIHAAEIAAWALFYWWQDCVPDAESAVYFSGVTYTTVGYGDLVLPREWRMLAPLEALTGILMYGLSTGLFFALVSRWIRNWLQTNAAPEVHSAVPIGE